MDTAPPSPEDVLEDLILAWATAAFQTTFPSGVGRRASGETDPCVIHTHLVYTLNYAGGPGVLLLDRTEMTEYHRMIPRGHWDTFTASCLVAVLSSEFLSTLCEEHGSERFDKHKV